MCRAELGREKPVVKNQGQTRPKSRKACQAAGWAASLYVVFRLRKPGSRDNIFGPGFGVGLGPGRPWLGIVQMHIRSDEIELFLYDK
jgi:hypothetical protein